MIRRGLLLQLGAIAAMAGCAGGAHTIRPFTTDACSLFPDGGHRDRASWSDCCVAHDIAYWRGGTADERLRADEALRACVLERTGDAALAKTMFVGVRTGGAPAFPTWYRWGYGWRYGRGYHPLDDAERRVAEEALAAWQRARSAVPPRR